MYLIKLKSLLFYMDLLLKQEIWDSSAGPSKTFSPEILIVELSFF